MSKTASQRRRPGGRGFTLAEAIVCMAIVTVLSALLLPAVSRANARAHRTTCLNNEKQINAGLRMYADDNNDTLPDTNAVLSTYKALMKRYVGLTAASAPNDTLFRCPADRFHVEPFLNQAASGGMYAAPESEFSSYGFNGLNRMSEFLPGIAGKKLGEIDEPTRTVLLAEMCAFTGFSWHEPANPPIRNNARSVTSFVDGHAEYIPIYWNGYLGKTDWPMLYDPPSQYGYRWSAGEGDQ